MNQKTFDKLILKSNKLLNMFEHNGRKHFSFIMDGRHIMSYGINNIRKTHTIAAKAFKYPFLHSEVKSVINFNYPPRFLRGLAMVNIRLSNSGEVLLAKPCTACQNFLEAFRLKAVWYSTNGQNFSRL